MPAITITVNVTDGYSTRDVQYRWASQSEPVSKYTDITMAQFTLTCISPGNKTTGFTHGKCNGTTGFTNGKCNKTDINFITIYIYSKRAYTLYASAYMDSGCCQTI